MSQVKCPDCGEMYSEDMQSCPNCGCPNDNWKPKTDESQKHPQKKPNSENSSKQQNSNISISISNGNTDWANYVYECGVLIWHTLSRRYMSFTGRASRREFWSFGLFFCWIWATEQFRTGAIIWTIVFLIPFLSSYVRRMHDINKSGWWALVPIASAFLALKKSDEGENDYGAPAVDDI